jgi:hypothetical protein
VGENSKSLSPRREVRQEGTLRKNGRRSSASL